MISRADLQAASAWLTKEHDVLVLNFTDGSRFRLFMSPLGAGLIFALIVWRKLRRR